MLTHWRACFPINSLESGSSGHQHEKGLGAGRAQGQNQHIVVKPERDARAASGEPQETAQYKLSSPLFSRHPCRAQHPEL